MSKRKKKDDSDKPEKSTGGTMYYPPYHISNKQLKLWANAARDGAEKKIYTDEMKRAVIRR